MIIPIGIGFGRLEAYSMESSLADALAQTGVKIPPHVQRLIEEKKIKDQVLKEAHDYAQRHVQHLLDPDAPEPDPFPGIDPTGDDRDEFLLVLDWFESIGLRFTPNVLRYESQNPDVTVARKALAQQYKLDPNSETPLLVQLVEERLKALKIDD
jgi:hypothetical protein